MIVTKYMLQLSCMDLKEFEGKVRGAVDIGFGDNLLRLPTIFNTIPDYKYPFDDLRIEDLRPCDFY